MEGADLVAAGLTAGHRPQALFVKAGTPAHEAAETALAGLPAYSVTEGVAQHISSLETAPDLLAVFPLPKAGPLAELRGAGALVVYTDRIADPGNMGTLIRAAAAFGAAALVASPESVDVFSPKVVRASMGAVFALPLYPGVTLAAALAELGRPRVYGLAAHSGREIGEAPLERPALLCVGAERAGLSPEVAASLDETLTIRLAGAEAAGVESLNAGVAGAIALYEFFRRRPAFAGE